MSTNQLSRSLATLFRELVHGYPDVLVPRVFHRLTARNVLTTEVIDWARGAVQEAVLAAKLMHFAQQEGTPPKHVDGRLLPTFIEGFLPKLPEGRVNVPTGCGAFPSQYDRRGVQPADPATARRAAEARYNVVHFATMPRGGHFPALEQPELWLDDLRAFFRSRQ